mgnify:CR=1 FL=1
MKKKGFTLIELLAVIVVLAIIALIATPIVMNTIEKSKKGAAERTADNYIDAVETTVATKRLDGDILEGTYTINDKGNLEGNGLAEPLVIEVNGGKPSSGTITIRDGQVTTDSIMTIDKYTVLYNPTIKKYEATKTTPSAIVYRWSTDTINIGDIIDPSDTTKFTKDPSTLGKDYYLKHVLDKDNKVTESYACAIFNSKEYCVRGGDSSFYGWAENESDYTGNVLIFKNLRDENIENMNCGFYDSSSGCGVGSAYLNAGSNGYGSMYGTNGRCNINADGSSLCSIN